MMKNFRVTNFHIKKSLAIFSLFCFLAWAFFLSSSIAINIPTFHIDGAFQTASGLFRLDAGQLPGKDFFPYLGIGPLFSLYPSFKVFGSDLAASVVSAHLMTIIFTWISISILWQLVFRPKTIIYSFMAGAILFFVITFMSDHAPKVFNFSIYLHPGYSLRPIRYSLPYIVILVNYLLIIRIRSDVLKSLSTGILAGATMLWSNDYAIPTTGWLAILFVFDLLLNKKKARRIISLFFIFFFTAILSWIILLRFFTFDHLLELMKYNFIDVAKDQWWYFGPYRESTRIFDLFNISRLISKENSFPLFILLLSIIVAVKTKQKEHILISWIGLVLFSGGSLASLGGHLGGYFSGLYFWGLITSLITILKISQRYINKELKQSFNNFFLIGSMAIILFSGSVSEWIHYYNQKSIAKNDLNRFYVTELGGYLNSDWKDYINFARSNSNRLVTEEYWGIWSAMNKTFPSWPVDSVIHALGNVRNIANTTMDSSDFIISTKYSASPIWQPWSLSHNFWFYDDLLLRWQPEKISPTTIVWKKSDIEMVFKNVHCEVFQEDFALKATKKGFYEVILKYNISGRGRYLVMVRNNISYRDQYISVDPDSSTVTFPVFLDNISNNTYDMRIVGNKKTRFSIHSCSAKFIEFKNPEILHVPNPEEFFLTDNNWIRGISRHWAAFFVPSTYENINQYKVGNSVKFSNGDTRKILSVTEFAGYLNVTVEGKILDSEIVGLPNSFIVINEIR